MVIKILHTDITSVKVDAIVNAANEWLYHGGGVARAIAMKAGKKLIEESRKIIDERGKLKVTNAIATSSGNLSKRGIKFVIHVVGPRGTKPKLLEQAVRNVFKLAKKLKIKSIALPAISCGIFGFDKKLGTKIIYEIAKSYEKYFDAIYLVSLDKEIVRLWESWKNNIE